MTLNRRTRDGSVLRKFFDDQLTLISNMLETRTQNKVRRIEENQMIESVVDSANKRIRSTPGYSGKLRECTRELYNYVRELTKQLPDAITLETGSFTRNPLVNSMFVVHEEIDRFLTSDLRLKQFTEEHRENLPPSVFAFMSATRSEKRVLGSGIVNDRVVKDVLQNVVNFSDHSIVAAGETPEISLGALRQFIFEKVVSAVGGEMNAAMDLQKKKLARKGPEAHIESLSNPSVYLKVLTSRLTQVIERLSLHKTSVRLSKSGYRLDDLDDQPVNQFELWVLSWDQQCQQVVVPVSIPVKAILK